MQARNQNFESAHAWAGPQRLGSSRSPLIERCPRRCRRPLGRPAPFTPVAAIPGPLYLASTPSDRTRLNAGSNPSSTFVPFPLRDDPGAKRTPPLVRVRLSVEYRVHSRQMLCVGGSAIPFGWSFLSIAKVPMGWTPTDLWVVDVELPAGSRVEYKYVVLEEQDWTRQVNELAEGRVDYTYRQAPDDSPPDVQRITKQMAIVAWQAGSNRVLVVPDEAELAALREAGGVVDRWPVVRKEGGAGSSSGSGRSYGRQAMGRGLGGGGSSSEGSGSEGSASEDEDGGDGQGKTWEKLSLDENKQPFLERRDVWGRGESQSR